MKNLTGKCARAAVDISIAGSGDTLIKSVSGSLDVNVAGSGDVRYYGDPAIDKSVLGSGSVKRLGAAPT